MTILIEYKNPITGKGCGWICKFRNGEHYYLTVRDKSSFMRKYQGFGISAAIISDLLNGPYQKYAIKKIIIDYRSESSINPYGDKCSQSDIWEGTVEQFNAKEPKDENCDWQHFVPIKELKRLKDIE